MFRAIGRSALIAAAGLCFHIAAPAAHAVESETLGEIVQAEAKPEAAEAPVELKKFTKRAKYSRRAQSRKFARASKSSRVAAKKNIEADAERNVAAAALKPDSVIADATSATLPPSVANASARWISSPQSAADLAASGMSAQANNALLSAQADAASQIPAPSEVKDVVDSDQLNDIDRNLSEAAQPLAAAQAQVEKVPVQPATTIAMAAAQGTRNNAPAAVASSDDSTWNQTSLIGKIFIAFGGLLTMASAARMFFA